MPPSISTSLTALLLSLTPPTTAQCYTATRFLPPPTCPPATKGGQEILNLKGSPKGKGCAFPCPLPTLSTVTIPPIVAACPETSTVTSFETACVGACPTELAACPKRLIVTVVATAAAAAVRR